MPSKFNDFSNPFDAEMTQNDQIYDQQMDGYGAKCEAISFLKNQ